MKLRTWCIRIGQILTKTVLVCTGFLVFLTLFNPATVLAEDDRGGITIRQQNVPIQKVFQTIEKQSGYRFFYNETLLQGAVKVTLNLQNVSLQVALEACFRNQPLSYAIVDKTIIVKRRPEQQPTAPVTAAVSLSRPVKIIAVRGKVTSNNVPVAGASIMIKGTDNGASTDKDGIFTLPEVDEDATLVISSVSHAAREVRLNGRTFVSIDLSKRTDDLEEAVIVAYNTTTRRMNTGSVAVVKGEDIQNLPSRSIDKSLQGMVPGLLVNNGNGQPGSGVSNFVLRGVATGGQALEGKTFANPLIVIDGIPVYQEPISINDRRPEGASYTNPMAQFNPSDIETISVLKDASAVSLYGSKASNGVILITTKKGRAGKPVFSFRHQTDIAQRLKDKIGTLNQDEYLELLYESYRNSNPGITDAQIKSDLISKFPYWVNSPGDTSFYPATNWIDEMYNSASTISNELSMSGGQERSNFYVNIEWTKQDGIEKRTGFDRKSLRFNYENKLTPWLKLGINTGISYSIQNLGNVLRSQSIMSFSPLNPVKKTNGEYIYNYTLGGNSILSGVLTANPVAATDLNINRNTSYRGLSKVYGELSVLKYFKLTSTVGVDYMQNEVLDKVHPLLALDAESTAGVGKIQEQSVRNANLIFTNLMRFDKIWANQHNLGVLIGHEAQVLSNKFLRIERRGLSANPGTDQVYAGGTIQIADGLKDKQTLLSYFGQINYSFLSRYLFSASIRTDGSSRFGANNRFGSFWSIGGGWIISAEPFMKSTNRWLNFLKVRGSFGPSGNSSAILYYYKLDRLVLLNNYLNSTAVIPNPNVPFGNPGIRWEQTFSWDAGLEIRMLNERISIMADIYNRKTKDLAGLVDFPLTGGSRHFIRDNIGDLRNKGMELSLTAKLIRTKDFSWNLVANWSRNNSVLLKSLYPLKLISGTNLANEVGRAYNSFYLPVWAGVNPDNGKPTWLDIDGKVTETYSLAARQFVGNAQPDGFGAITSSFNYRGLELSAMFYYQYGNEIWQGGYLLQNDGLYPYANQSKNALDRWQKPGDQALNPRRLLNGMLGSTADDGTQPSTRFLYKGDFIRFSNLILSYNLPKKVISPLRLTMLKIFVQGHNLATWTKYPGQDPENLNGSGEGDYVYPQQRTFSFGINLYF
jgi:TonB-linked SusC/RagA family outer membrane protein